MAANASATGRSSQMKRVAAPPTTLLFALKVNTYYVHEAQSVGQGNCDSRYLSQADAVLLDDS